MPDFGPWQELQSSAGKTYYYNRLTQKSQWQKPAEWVEHDRLHINGDGSKLKPISSPPAPPTISNNHKRDHHHSYQHEATSTQTSHPTTNGYNNNHHHHQPSYSHSNYPTHSSTNQQIANESLSDDRKLEAISDDEGPPSKKVKSDDPLANVEMISEDSLSASKETADERENYLLMTDDDIERYISDEFLTRARIPELDQIEGESRKYGARQRETERELVDIVKDQITVRQLVTTTQMMRTVVEIRSEFSKRQSESHGFDTQ